MIELERWHSWTGASSGVSFFDKISEKISGNGELKFAAELRSLGYSITDNGKKSLPYDVETNDGFATEKWEVKELGTMRVEKSGTVAAQHTLNQFRNVVDALIVLCSNVGLHGFREIAKIYEIDIDELGKFSSVALERITTGNIPKGLMYGSRDYPVGFLDATDKIREAMIKLRDSFVELTINVKTLSGDHEVLKKTLEEDDVMALLQIIMKHVPLSDELMRGISFTTLIRSTFKSFGVYDLVMARENMEKAFTDAFEPRNIMNHVDYIVVVDETKGFFVFRPQKLLEFYSPTQISKVTQQFSSKPVLGKKSKKKDNMQLDLFKRK